MSRRFDRAIFLVILLVICCTVAFAGKVELTTYYPAPVGEYTTLSAKGKDTSNSTVAFQAGGSAGTGLVVTNANEVGIGTTSPKGILDLNTTTAAFYPPRVITNARNAIASNSTIDPNKYGAVVYNSDNKRLEVYTSVGWKSTGGFVWKKVSYPHKAHDYFSEGEAQHINLTAVSITEIEADAAPGRCMCSDLDFATPSDVSTYQNPAGGDNDTWGGSLEKLADHGYYFCDNDNYGGCTHNLYYLATQ